MDDNLCYSARYCRNRKIMCAFCKLQNKYIPKISQTTAQTINMHVDFAMTRDNRCDNLREETDDDFFCGYFEPKGK